MLIVIGSNPITNYISFSSVFSSFSNLYLNPKISTLKSLNKFEKILLFILFLCLIYFIYLITHWLSYKLINIITTLITIHNHIHKHIHNTFYNAFYKSTARAEGGEYTDKSYNDESGNDNSVPTKTKTYYPSAYKSHVNPNNNDLVGNSQNSHNTPTEEWVTEIHKKVSNFGKSRNIILKSMGNTPDDIEVESISDDAIDKCGYVNNPKLTQEPYNTPINSTGVVMDDSHTEVFVESTPEKSMHQSYDNMSVVTNPSYKSIVQIDLSIYFLYSISEVSSKFEVTDKTLTSLISPENLTNTLNQRDKPNLIKQVPVDVPDLKK